MNTVIVLNFIRSANAPQIKAGVMMKNIPWNSMWVSRGITPSIGSIGPAAPSGHERWTSFMNKYSPLPIHLPSPPKASE